LPSKVYGFLQEAVSLAIQYFDELAPKTQNGDPPLDPHLFPHLVRYQVCRLLRQEEFDASIIDDEDVPPSVRVMAMSGIEIEFRNRKIKIWKSRKGGIPLPGRSASRKAFLQENQVLFGSAGEFFKARNLVLLWDVDSTGDVTLELVCPMPSDFKKHDAADWKSPQLWSVAVPDAATLIQLAPGSFAADSNAGYDEAFGENISGTSIKEEGQ
jgi:hypothetical protein